MEDMETEENPPAEASGAPEMSARSKSRSSVSSGHASSGWHRSAPAGATTGKEAIAKAAMGPLAAATRQERGATKGDLTGDENVQEVRKVRPFSSQIGPFGG